MSRFAAALKPRPRALSSTKCKAASVRKAVGWLEAQNDALGCELANAVDALCSGRAAPITKGALLPRVALLKGFKPLEHALLAQHLAPLASLCSWRRYAIGDEVELASTESAVVAKGAVAVPAAVLERGVPTTVARRWWGSRAGAIAPTQAAAMRPCSILVLDADALRQRIDASSPKFVFAVLRALVGALPAPRQAGGGDQAHAVHHV